MPFNFSSGMRPPVNDLNKPAVPGTPPPMFGNGNIGFRNPNPPIGSAPMGFQTQQIGQPGFELGGVPILGGQQQQVPGAGVSALAPNSNSGTPSYVLPTDPNARPFVNNKGPAPDMSSAFGNWMAQTQPGYNQGGGMQQGNKNPQQSSGVQPPQNGGKNPPMGGGASTQPVYPGRG